MDEMLKILKENKHDVTSATFKENLYKYYVENNYSNRCFTTLSKELDIKSGILKSYIYSYAKNVLHKNAEEFDKYRYEQRDLNEKYYLGKKNIVLEKHGIITNYIWHNEKEREIFLKDIYEYSSKYKFSLSSTKRMADKLGISNAKYLYLVKTYMKEFLKKEDLEVDKQLNFTEKNDQIRLNNTKKMNAYKNIINSTSNEEIEEILKESNYARGVLANDFRFFEKFFSEEEAELFREKIGLYKEFIQLKKLNNKNFLKRKIKTNNSLEHKDEVLELFNEYINSKDLSCIKLLKKHNMDIDTFKERVEMLKDIDLDLYDAYIKAEEEKKELEKEELKVLQNKLINGFEQDNKVREFDIIDYYSFTNIPLTKIHLLGINDFDKRARDKINALRVRFKDTDKENVADELYFLEEKRFVDLKRDKNGNLILDSGRELTKEEKKTILNYLRDNNIAVNRVTINVGVKRYLAGFIKKDNVKKLTLTDK